MSDDDAKTRTRDKVEKRERVEGGSWV